VRSAYKLENEWCMRPIKALQCWAKNLDVREVLEPTRFVRSELSLEHMIS
jgi:hypothetical protein